MRSPTLPFGLKVSTYMPLSLNDRNLEALAYVHYHRFTKQLQNGRFKYWDISASCNWCLAPALHRHSILEENQWHREGRMALGRDLHLLVRMDFLSVAGPDQQALKVYGLIG